MAHYYTYRITNLITKNYYLGKRKYRGKDITKDKYLGSGAIITAEVVKYGRENFKKEILAQFQSPEAMNEAERILVNEDVINDELSYNVILGGTGFQNEEHYINLSKIMKYVCNQEAYKSNMRAVINSPEVQEKTLATMKKTMNDPEWKLWFSSIQKEVQNRPEERERNSRAQKIAQNRPEVKAKKQQIMKEIFQNEEVQIKHKQACNSEQFIEAHRQNLLGTKWMNNGKLQKYVKKENFQTYLEEGWVFGMKKKHKGEYR